jgi:hypothetical protein
VMLAMMRTAQISVLKPAEVCLRQMLREDEGKGSVKRREREGADRRFLVSEDERRR